MIQIDKIWLFESEVIDPFYFGSIDGVEIDMKDERTISLINIDVCEYVINTVGKGGFTWDSNYGGEDKGALTTLGKQEYDYELSFDLPLYSGRIIDEMSGRLFSVVCERRNGTRFVVLAQFQTDPIKIEDEQVSRVVMKSGRTSAQLYNCNSLNIGTINDEINCSTVHSNIDKFGRMNFDFFPTTNIPENFQFKSATDTSVTFEWIKGLGANGYRLIWGTDINVLDQVVNIQGGEIQEYTVTGLSQSVTIYARIKSTGDFTDSLFTPIVSGTTLLMAPEIPTGLALTPISGSEIQADWDAQLLVDQFIIEWDTDPLFSAPSTANASGASTSYNITGLDPETLYYVRIKAENTAGESGYAPTESATTLSAGFILKIDTNNAGSPSNQINLPVVLATNATNKWGDGNEEPAVVGTMNHVYSIAGVYDITVTGDDIGLSFNFAGDRLKALEVVNAGILTIDFAAFQGCSNLVWSATDAPKNIISLESAFQGCNLGTPDLTVWDVSNVTDFIRAFTNNSNFNSDISGWTIRNDTNVFMNNMFQLCASFDQNISLWDYSGVTTLALFLDNSGLGTANYDLLLLKWDSQVIPLANFNIGVSGLTYTLGGAAETARTNLIGKGWVFVGDSGI